VKITFFNIIRLLTLTLISIAQTLPTTDSNCDNCIYLYFWLVWIMAYWWFSTIYCRILPFYFSFHGWNYYGFPEFCNP